MMNHATPFELARLFVAETEVVWSTHAARCAAAGSRSDLRSLHVVSERTTATPQRLRQPSHCRLWSSEV